jgi:hypothetical protein
MKNERIVKAFNAIQPGDEVKNRVFGKVILKEQKKRSAFKTVVSFATSAAVICMILFGSMLLSQQGDSVNEYFLKAYALEQQYDGSIEFREVDLHNDTLFWATFYDGSTFYVGANLKCEGENISSVIFHLDNGFFAKQYLKIENGKIVLEEGVATASYKYPGTELIITMYGQDFDDIGNSLTLDANSMTDDYLLFVGMELSDWEERPKQITVHAIATFNDGKTLEETIALPVEYDGLLNSQGSRGFD